MKKALLGAPFVFAKGSHPPLPQRNLHIGVVVREARQDVRYDAEDGRPMDPHIQSPQLAAPARCARFAAWSTIPGVAQQGFPRMVQHRAAWSALEQLRADLGLQGLDLAGERGWGQVQALCGSAEVALFRYGYEIG
ncbi:MAG: hypothetical protein U5N23_15085 [Acidovorax sp.]|nr:hypothetical protein [Acidovorax sp.]MDZ7864097.1 hypothetical protein [Acidovorax sp.]